MSKPNQRPAPLTKKVWPPPPTVGSHSPPEKSHPSWFRPAFWVGVGFNVLACILPLLLLREPTGSEQMSDDIELAPLFALPFGSYWVAALALLIGVPFVIGQMRKCQRLCLVVGWEIAGLLLYFTPSFVGWAILQMVRGVKHFDSIA